MHVRAGFSAAGVDEGDEWLGRQIHMKYASKIAPDMLEYVEIIKYLWDI